MEEKKVSDADPREDLFWLWQDEDYWADEEPWYAEKITRRRVLQTGGALLGAAAAGPLIFTTVDAEEAFQRRSNLPYKAHTGIKGNVEFWHHWASPLRRSAIRTAIRQFNRFYPNIHVKDVAFPFGTVWDKTVAAVAAKKGMADVVVSDRPTLWNFGHKKKVYERLTTLAKRDHINGKQFWPFTWREAVVSKQLYGLPYETDVRVLYWNRAKFMDAGLNANKGPVTWADLDRLSDKLDVKGGPGFETIGFSPTWGSGAGLPSLIWLNRGE